MPSASGCNRPKGPTRFGPYRFWKRPRPLRSRIVVRAKRDANAPRMAMADNRADKKGCTETGERARSQCLSRTKIWSIVAVIAVSFSQTENRVEVLSERARPLASLWPQLSLLLRPAVHLFQLR